MNLDFLDNGLPLESGNYEKAAEEITRFRLYCERIGKKTSELTEQELNDYRNSIKEK